MQSNTKVIHFKYESDLDNQRYTAVLTLKRFSLADNQRIAVRMTQINGGFAAEENGVGLNTFDATIGRIIATVEAGVQRPHPDWLNPEDMFDLGLLMAVYEEVKNFQDSFRPKPKPVVDVVREAGSTPNSRGSVEPGSAEPMVFPQVQGTLVP